MVVAAFPSTTTKDEIVLSLLSQGLISVAADDGRVFSQFRLRGYPGGTRVDIVPWFELTYHLKRTGYVQVSLCGKQVLLHRLVWLAEHGPILEDLEVDHIDKNKLNNRIENLRLLTHRENTIDNPGRYGWPNPLT